MCLSWYRVLSADSLVHCRSMQRGHQEKLESKFELLAGKVEETSKQHKASITSLQDVLESGKKENETALSNIQSDLKLGWLRQLGTELIGMVCRIFEMSGTTLSAVQRIEEKLQSRADMALSRTLTLEDPLGRVTLVDMVYVSSWNAFDSVLEICFRDLPGHKKVAKKEYILQDRQTNRELQRSIPWSGAFMPGQHIIMGLIFREPRKENTKPSCPACLLPLERSRGGLISSWQVSCQVPCS